MIDYFREKLQKLISNFRPITPTIQPTHVQSWDAQPKRRKK